MDLPPELAALVARRLSILGEPTRLRLLNLLHARGAASVGELTDAIGGSQANVSKHLGLLLAEGMVARRREGSRAIYTLADQDLIALCDQVCASVRRQVSELNARIADDATARAA